jgi:hypothetical protein
MRLLLIALMLSTMSACGMMEQRTADTYSEPLEQFPSTGNGG